jgi:hypothetical protein
MSQLVKAGLVKSGLVAARLMPDGSAGVDLFGGITSDYIIKIMCMNPLAFWTIGESGGSVLADSMRLYNGTYSNIALQHPGIGGYTSGFWNGTSSVGNVYSAGLASNFNVTELTLMNWVKYPPTAWTDATLRYSMLFGVNFTSNYVGLRKATATNSVGCEYKAGNTSKAQVYAAPNLNDFIHVAMTVSVTNDQLKLYINGVQSGATITGLGTWAGALAATRCCLGSSGTTPANVTNGWIQFAAVFTRALTQGEILNVAQI